MLHDRVSYDYLHYSETVTNKCQNLSEQFPRLDTELLAVCFETFDKANPDETLTLLVYEAHHFQILQVPASNPASGFPLLRIERRIREIIKSVVTLHPQRHRLKLKGQHYALVAWHSMRNYLYVNPLR